MRKERAWIAVFLFFTVVPVVHAEQHGQSLSEVPAKGMVTMVDVGAHQCIPCRMMAPIIRELKKEYQGKAAIVFIDVWKNREEARRYDIRAIPTQIFYDKDGKEVFRHVGFLDKKGIVSILERMGVK